MTEQPSLTGADPLSLEAPPGSLLGEVCDRLTGQACQQTALSEVARLLATALRADGCLVFAVENDGELLLVASHPALDPAGAPLRLPAGFGVTGRVAVDRIPVTLVDDNPRNPRHRQVLGLATGQTVSRLCVPGRLAGGDSAVVLAVHSRARRRFSPSELARAQQVADLVALRVGIGAAAELVEDYRARCDAIVASTVTAQESERRRVASDLHDGVTQAIASLTFHLSAAQLAIDEGDVGYAAAQLATARELADLAFGETRSAITGLHSPVLEDLGLAAGLESLARGVPNLEVDVQAQDLTVPEHIGVSLFRVAQESLHNVVKHAAASNAVIRLAKHGRMLTLTVTDDGRGFQAPGQLSGVPHAVRAGSGYGLNGMAERVRLIGGELRVRSAPEQGTTVEVTVPDVF